MAKPFKSPVSDFFDKPTHASSRPGRAEKRLARKVLKEDRQFKRHGTPLVAKNEAQADYLEVLAESKVTLVCGPAGTGKTYVAARYGIERVLDGTYEKMIITRPMVAVSGEDIGFLPGGIADKVAPWGIPLMDSFKDSVGKEELERMVRDERILFVPFAYIRGRTFNDAFIMADESQNLTIEQFKVLITRVGENSQIVVDGDLKQSDLRGLNGLKFAIDIADTYGLDCEVFEFDDGDVVRSAITAQWVRAFSQHEAATS